MNHNLLLNEKWKELKSYLNEATSILSKDSFNIFSVSSYTAERENFHSDIWEFLLDRNASHNKGDLFLDLFLNYLRTEYQLTLDNYLEASVAREESKIDLLVRNSSGHCIIVESKVNNAPDQPRQLERYVEAVEKKGFQIDAVLYVSQDGLRSIKPNIPYTVTSIAACDNKQSDLLNGWLLKCVESVKGQEDDERIHSFLLQYIYLVQSLTPLNYFKMLDAELYKILNRKEDFDTAVMISDRLEYVKLHRLEVFRQGVADLDTRPFTKQGTYEKTPNYLIYRNWTYKEANFTLGIIIYKDRTEFVIYDQSQNMDMDSLKVVINFIAPLQHPFAMKQDIPNHFHFIVRLGEGKIGSLEELDTLTISLAKELFGNIQKLHGSLVEILN